MLRSANAWNNSVDLDEQSMRLVEHEQLSPKYHCITVLGRPIVRTSFTLEAEMD